MYAWLNVVQGCMNKLKQELESKLYIVGVTCIVVVLIQVIALLIVCYDAFMMWS